METYRKFYVPLLGICFMYFAIQYIGKSELVHWGGDESRHFMNGVFVRDFIADGAWRFPLEYAKWYYLKYPALSLHQYPPLFYLLEALVFFFFGIHVLVVQGGILAISGLSLYLWYRSISRKYQPEIAFLSVITFMTTALFLNNFSRIMLDGISLSMILIFLFFLDRWQHSKQRKHLLIAFGLLFTILLIAFKTYFMLFYFLGLVGYQWVSKRWSITRWSYLTLFFLGLFLLFFTFGTIAQETKIPLLYRTMQGANMMSVNKLKRMLRSDSFDDLFRLKLISTFGIYNMLLIITGLGYAIKNKEWGKIRDDVFYAANFVFVFTCCITHFEPDRFNMFLLPFSALMTGYALYNLANILKGKAFLIGMLCIALFLVWQGGSLSSEYFRGYEHAAQDVVLMNDQHHPILCDSYFDGNFIAYVRKYDQSKQQIVFRGDKVLFVSVVYYSYIKETYAENEEDVYKLLDRYSIRYILADSLYLNIKQKILLRNVLQNTKKFRHIKKYQISTNMKEYKEAGLDLYEYVDYNTDYAQPIKISLPVVEEAFSFTIHELKNRLKHF